MLSHFSGRRARERYAQFVHDGLNQSSIWSELQQQIYLGDERFVTQMQSRLASNEALEEVPKAQRQLPPPSLETLTQEHADRDTMMAAAYLSGVHTMKAIAAYSGVHYSTVSRAVKKAETVADAAAGST